MPFPYDKYPWLNFQELNLAYFIRHFREIFQEWAQLLEDQEAWKTATEQDIADWKADTLTALSDWQDLAEQNIAGWEADTLAALTAWQTAAETTFEAIRVQAAADAASASASATAADAAKTAALAAQTAAEAAAASVSSSAAQISQNTGDIAHILSHMFSTTLADATLLSSGDDLFALPIGNYFSNSSTITATILNKPSELNTGFRACIFEVSASTRKGIVIINPTRQLFVTAEGSNGYYSWQQIRYKEYIDDQDAALETALTALIDANTADDTLRYNADQARFELADSLLNVTINLLDPSTNTEGYILVNNEPSARANYYYTDYIKIGNFPVVYYRDQGATISYLMSCYDENKNYLGAVDYSTPGYERITGTSPSGYYKLVPRKGTVYVRLNGRYTSNLMFCPYFYPSKGVPYGHIGLKDTIRLAMFGDSIILGTDGSGTDGALVEKNIPYWMEQITGFTVDNLGVGSMGWVSTAYNPQIAYDKISSTDLSPYNVICLCYGVNDSAATLGTWDSSDTSTIMGQVNKCIKYIGAQNPNAMIIIIAPWNGAASGTFPNWRYTVTTSGGFTRAQLSDTLKQAAEYYYIGFISQKDSPLNGFGIGTVSGETTGPFLGTDHVHPTEAGYHAIGEWLAAKISGIVM